MIRPRGGRALIIAVAVLASLLVAGRWLAVETAERAWAASVTGGAGTVYLETRALARLARLAVWVIATVWGIGNLYIVYRAIGSVQMPRRVGNLEIVEAVPQRLLLALAIAGGVVFGSGLAWGTGDWWEKALLAGGAPRFARLDPLLHRDLGYYVGQLPWALERQRFLQLATLTAAVLVAFLYAGIGSLRWQGGRLIASPHARAHAAVLLAGVAIAVLWGALLDPAEVVGGMHGDLDAGILAIRLPGAPVVAIAAGVALAASLGWAWWDRPRWLAVGWALLVITMLGVYAILPAVGRGGGGPGAGSTTALFASERGEFEALAFGTSYRMLASAPEFPSMDRFVAASPLWSAARVAAAARGMLGEHQAVAGVGLARSADGRPLWLVARAPDDSAQGAIVPPPTWEQAHRGPWTVAGPPLGFVETDTGLDAVPLAVGDSTSWFGEGYSQYAVSPPAPDRAWELPPAGIPLTGAWRRIALAWVLQSPEIARRTEPDDRLVWRRTASERLSRLAPFAQFDPPEPVIADGAVWWLAAGYVSAETFPLVRAQRGRPRFQRAGLVGAVRAMTGETRIWLLPGADSLSTAWARLYAPLVAPAESLPAALVAGMRFPSATFTLAVERLLASVPDSDRWRQAAREPYELLPPNPVPGGGAIWLAQGFTSGQAPRFEGLLLGRFASAGPELLYVTPRTADPPPQLLVGVNDTVPGPLRLWLAAGHLASSQARFFAPTGARPLLQRVYLTWGNRVGEGETALTALHDLAAAGPPGIADTSLGARWAQAQRIFAELDQALQARDFERFGRAYRQLAELLRARRVLAPLSPLQ